MHRRDSEAEPQPYEFAHERDVIKLDRFLPSSVVYKQLEIGLDEHGRAVVLNVAPKRFFDIDPSEALGRAVAENIYPKLGVADKASAVAKALRFGLID
jgi:thymidylate kinase